MAVGQLWLVRTSLDLLQRHAFNANRHSHFDLAVSDRIRDVDDRLETRGTQPVDCGDGHFDGDTCSYRCSARYIQRRGRVACSCSYQSNQPCSTRQKTRTNTYVFKQSGIQPGLLEGSLEKRMDEYMRLSESATATCPKERSQEFVHRDVLELALLRASERSPFGKCYDDIVRSFR